MNSKSSSATSNTTLTMMRQGVSAVSQASLLLLRKQTTTSLPSKMQLRVQSTVPGAPIFNKRKPGGGPGTDLLRVWYNWFGASNAMYTLFLVGGVIVAETGAIGFRDFVWNTINHGHTWESTDWSKFRESVEEDEDEEEEEEDEEEAEDDDKEDGDDEEE